MTAYSEYAKYATTVVGSYSVPRWYEKLPGFAKETRPKPITKKDPNVFHPAAVCVRSIGYADLGLVEEFRTVSFQTDRDVKVIMTGPHMLAKVAFDEHYGDIGKMMRTWRRSSTGTSGIWKRRGAGMSRSTNRCSPSPTTRRSSRPWRQSTLRWGRSTFRIRTWRLRK